MFNPSNDCYMTSSSSSSNVIYNRSHSNARYHPYNRSYCSSNELETYSFDNNNNSLHHPHPTHLAAPVQTYETSTMPYDYNLPWPTPTSSSMETNEMTMDGTMGHTANLGGTGTPHCFKRRVSANKKERRRTQSINTAFSDLRTAIPNVQPDTKLSKIKTLKLATKYIEFLMDILAKDDSTAMPSAFKAEIIKTRKDHRDLMKFDHSLSPRKIKGRTGWPQAVWQSELNRNENFHQHPTGKTPAHASTSSVSNSPTLSHPSSSSSSKTTKHAMTR